MDAHHVGRLPSAIRIGPASITAVEELRVAFPAAGLFGGNATDQDVIAEAGLLAPGSYDPVSGALLLAVQSFVISTSSRTILVDTGCGNGRSRPSARWCDMLATPWPGRLSEMGVEADDVDLVVNTHLHVDHVGWNVRADAGEWVPTFANATYVFGDEEYRWWSHEHAARGPHSSAHQRAAFEECVEPIVAAGRADLVGRDAVLHREADLEIRLEPLPGHTPHQSGVHVRSGGSHAFLIADAVHHAMQFRRRDWQGRADFDRQMARATVDRLIESYADTGTIIIAAHVPWSGGARLVGRGSQTVLLDAGQAGGDEGASLRAAVN